MKKRKLLIVDTPDNYVEHAGRVLHTQLIERIKARQASEGMLAFEPGFFSALNLLETEADPISALGYYGEVSEWLDKTVSHHKAKQKASLEKFLASRP